MHDVGPQSRPLPVTEEDTPPTTLLRVIGYRRERGTYRQLSYAQALKKTGCQSVEATIRQRRLLFAGAIARQPDGRLPKRLVDGKLVGGEIQARDARSRRLPKQLMDRKLVGGEIQARDARSRIG